MGADPLTIGLTLAAVTAATTGGLSYVESQQQNKALKRSERSAKEAAAVQGRQLNDQTAVERAKRIQEGARIRARIRAAAAESGFDPSSGVYEDLLNLNDYETAANLDILDRNLVNNQARVASGLDASLADIDSRRSPALLRLLSSTIAGAGTGLSLGIGINELGKGT